jgi:hypothetical protein
MDKNDLKQTLPAPIRVAPIPEDAKWLAGEGAGSWFHLIREGENWRISRYSPTGSMECTGKFYLLKGEGFDWRKPYTFIHLSHCQMIRITQSAQKILMVRISD